MLSEPEVREVRRMIKEQVDIMREQFKLLEEEGNQGKLLNELGIYGMFLSGLAVAAEAILKGDLNHFCGLEGTVMEIVNNYKKA